MKVEKDLDLYQEGLSILSELEEYIQMETAQENSNNSLIKQLIDHVKELHLKNVQSASDDVKRAATKKRNKKTTTKTETKAKGSTLKRKQGETEEEDEEEDDEDTGDMTQSQLQSQLRSGNHAQAMQGIFSLTSLFKADTRSKTRIAARGRKSTIGSSSKDGQEGLSISYSNLGRHILYLIWFIVKHSCYLPVYTYRFLLFSRKVSMILFDGGSEERGQLNSSKRKDTSKNDGNSLESLLPREKEIEVVDHKRNTDKKHKKRRSTTIKSSKVSVKENESIEHNEIENEKENETKENRPTKRSRTSIMGIVRPPVPFNANMLSKQANTLKSNYTNKNYSNNKDNNNNNIHRKSSNRETNITKVSLENLISGSRTRRKSVVGHIDDNDNVSTAQGEDENEKITKTAATAVATARPRRQLPFNAADLAVQASHLEKPQRALTIQPPTSSTSTRDGKTIDGEKGRPSTKASSSTSNLSVRPTVAAGISAAPFNSTTLQTMKNKLRKVKVDGNKTSSSAQEQDKKNKYKSTNSVINPNSKEIDFFLMKQTLRRRFRRTSRESLDNSNNNNNRRGYGNEDEEDDDDDEEDEDEDENSVLSFMSTPEKMKMKKKKRNEKENQFSISPKTNLRQQQQQQRGSLRRSSRRSVGIKKDLHKEEDAIPN